MVVAAQLVDQLQPRRQVQHRQLPLEDPGDPCRVVARAGTLEGARHTHQ